MDKAMIFFAWLATVVAGSFLLPLTMWALYSFEDDVFYKNEETSQWTLFSFLAWSASS